MTGTLHGDLAGKVAIVTGSTQGIGAAVARRIIAWGGAGVVITGRDAARGEAVADTLKRASADALFVPADLHDAAAPQRLLDACLQRFGRIDCLVNAAADTARASLLDAKIDFIDAMFAANLRAPFLLMQGAARAMRAAGQGGAIVNILSVNAYCGQPDLAVYAASKGALATLTRNAAHALRGDRIRVNGIMLGWAETPAEHAVQEKTSPHGADWLAEANRTRPFGRLIQPDEVAALTAYLLSAQAGVMTGSLIDFEQAVLGGPPTG